MTTKGRTATKTASRTSSGGEAENSTPNCPVVGIGASAGGISALQNFVSNISAGSGLAYVVVQHLDPEHESNLAAILQRQSVIEAKVVEDEAAIEPNTIYVIPPAASITLKERRLHLKAASETQRKRTPIDDFLISLAEDQNDNAACVILSGTGSDGTVGLQAIKGHGGLALAQDGAEYDGMMRSAVATGLVDMIMPVEEMPAKIAEYFHHVTKVGTERNAERLHRVLADNLARIAALLRERSGHDFSGYKDSTIVRRIQRRMQVLQIDDPAAFYDKLKREPIEIDFLFQDLLIGVTSFFRDREQFTALEEEVIPKLFEGKGPDDVVRIWIPGCSTGEEAYSIAMLLREHSQKNHSAPKLQIFASDIDERALEVARMGRYPATVAENVSPTRLRQFFSREDGTYRITSDLREMCLFSPHNMLRDPPFSRLDLISCRNLLIYLGAELQERVIPLFHYALREGGFLFLGSSENIARHGRLFVTVDKNNRIFQKRARAATRLPEFPLTARVRIPAVNRSPEVAIRNSFQDLAERELLNRHSPAYVIVTETGELMHSSAGTGKYLELPHGSPDHNVLTMARTGLRLHLSAALQRAVRTGRPVMQKDITVGTNGGRQTFDLAVQPLRRDGDTVYLVVFRDQGGIKQEKEGELQEADEDVIGGNVRHLEAELKSTRERLQATTEELESSNEELKSANEELSSINEELQSSNEELETSKEELQSMNEELQTVNSELNARVEELSRANSDVSNLLESTQIATVFLDQQLSVKSFTPASKDLFRLVESDVGRPLSHVRARFEADTLQDDAEQVLRKLGTIERQIDETEDGSRYMMRILPYRTVENVIAGVVITFVDVTQITLAEERISELSQNLRNRVESLETLFDLMPVGIMIDEDGGAETARINRYGAELLGRDHGDEKLLSIPADLPLQRKGAKVALMDQPLRVAARTGRPTDAFEARIKHANGDDIDVLMAANPLFDEAGRVRGAIASMVDITFRKKAEARQEMLLHELQHRVKNILATVTALASRMVGASTSIEQFSSAFVERLRAMARTHEVLSKHNWEGADLRALIDTALTPYSNEKHSNISATGPTIVLRPNAAATLGMVLFELANNAAKYGALASDSGSVEVTWQVEDKETPTLVLSWQERGGAAVEPPDSEGFGTNFIRRSLAYEMGGSADISYDRSGVLCRLRLPLEPAGR
ncbi:MAG: CheR family methyltransferase [Mesorhizobium sp.]